MLDWQKLVRQRLSGLALDAPEKDEVQVELAAHLEESYESLRTNGLPKQAAMQQTLAQVADWQDLRRRIDSARRKKDNMTNRVRQLWIPGFLALAVSMTALTLIMKFGPQPRILSLGSVPAIVVYVPWLAVLPLIGAAGAYLSKRAGGSRFPVLTSSVFPVLPFVAASLLMIPVSMILDREHATHGLTPAGILCFVLGWIVFCGLALLAGGLLTQLLVSRRSTSRT
jgi:hypothetical protein